MRRVYALKGGKWKEIAFNKIKKGNIFRMYEANLKPVRDDLNNEVFFAKSASYINGTTLKVDCGSFSLDFLSAAEKVVVDTAIQDQIEVIARMGAPLIEPIQLYNVSKE